MNDFSGQDKKHPYEVKKIHIDDPEFKSETPEHLQNKDIPGFPTTVLCVGGPGSGKSNLFMNFLLHHWNRFFDKVYLFGPTCKSDKIYKNIKLPDDQVCVDEEEFIPRLQELVNKQLEEVKHDPKQAPRCLFGFEDITSYYDQVQRHPAFARCFNAIRHHKATAWANVHKYKAMNRTARNCAKHVMVWPIVDTDLKQIAEDFSIPGINHKQFMALAHHAWNKSYDSEKPFFYINTYAEPADRFRRNFTEIIGYRINSELALGSNIESGKGTATPGDTTGLTNKSRKKNQSAQRKNLAGTKYEGKIPQNRKKRKNPASDYGRMDDNNPTTQKKQVLPQEAKKKDEIDGKKKNKKRIYTFPRYLI